ncbi:RluA family pseudouridine synthase [Blautia sp. Marseille-P3201T]|uniref:RluA family pseudouridine synthase n=1 Tax=Blautia sp. Marseille-P3201T TaxID=1907659 RepID=UPI000930A613|nr:RluA family pseudouridine synthase [Blautia sp. Marseille-P3201T]
MNRIFEYTITDENLPCTVGDFLKQKGFSRQIIIQLKKTSQGILVNNQWAYVRTPLRTNDILTLRLLEEAPSENIVPVSLPLDIIYEDEDILLINKPADMPVHPSINNYDNTLANGIAHYYKMQGETFVFRCINRLDRDTTGLLIIAKNALSASILSNQMKRREIHRTYLAVVSGNPKKDTDTITAPIARKENSAIERCIDFQNGEQAVTHYQLITSREDYSLLKLSLETGRTHQIRVHMKYIGNPLLGDYLYNPDFSKIQRVALHSYRLNFIHPITEKTMDFSIPLPEDMANLF